MTNREKLEKYCEEHEVELEILTYDDVMDNCDGDDICSAEDFTGYDMDESDLAYWLVDYTYFIIVNRESDITDRELEDVISFLEFQETFG